MEAAQPPGMALGQAPSAVSSMFPSELFGFQRIAPRRATIPHPGQFRSLEQLQLPHGLIVPEPGPVRCPE
jgi:hypothetical protein